MANEYTSDIDRREGVVIVVQLPLEGMRRRMCYADEHTLLLILQHHRFINFVIALKVVEIFSLSMCGFLAQKDGANGAAAPSLFSLTYVPCPILYSALRQFVASDIYMYTEPDGLKLLTKFAFESEQCHNNTILHFPSFSSCIVK
jgi:hypothetical protein